MRLTGRLPPRRALSTDLSLLSSLLHRSITERPHSTMPRLSGKNVYFDESSKANVNIKVQGYTLHAHKDILRQHVCFDNCLRSGTWSVS